MKVAILADLHLHNFNSSEVRLDNGLAVLSEVSSYANNKGINYILLAGDLFHTFGTLNSLVINRTLETFYKLEQTYPKIKFIAISGNHDQASRNTLKNQSETSIQYLTVLNNFIRIDNDIYTLDKGFKVLGIPYYEPFDLEEVLSAYENKGLLDDVGNTIVLMHQTPVGLFNSFIPTDLDPEDLSFFKAVFYGHIHRHQKLTKNSYMVGSPIHIDSGDIGDTKGFLVYDLDTDKVTREELRIFEIPRTEKLVADAKINTSKMDLQKAPDELVDIYLQQLNITDPLTLQIGKQKINESYKNKTDRDRRV